MAAAAARCGTKIPPAVCGAAPRALERIDPGPEVAERVRLALDPGGVPHAFYASDPGGVAYHAVRTGDGWIREEIRRARGLGPVVAGTLLPPASAPAACWREEGGVECGVARAAGWTTVLVDAAPSDDPAVDVAGDEAGRLHVAYFAREGGLGELRHAVWDPLGGPASFETVDGGPETGETMGLSVSLGLLPQADPLVAYYDESLGNLKVARWNGVLGGWEKSTVEWRHVVGEPLTFAPVLDDPDCTASTEQGADFGFTASDGVALLAYPSDGRLVDTTVEEEGIPIDPGRIGFCTPGKLFVRGVEGGFDYAIDYVRTDTSPEDDGRDLCLVVDPSRGPGVAYLDWDTLSLRYAVPSTGDWSWEVADGFGRGGRGLSMVLDPVQGRVVLAFADTLARRLVFAVRSETGWSSCTGDGRSGSGVYPSIVWNPQGGFSVAYALEPPPGGRSLWYARVEHLAP